MQQQSDTNKIRFQTQSGKYNLTVIDRDPEVNNFVYHGLSLSEKVSVEHQFKTDFSYISFLYDEGEVLISKSVIHSLVFNDYATPEMMEEETEEEQEQHG